MQAKTILRVHLIPIRITREERDEREERGKEEKETTTTIIIQARM